MDLYKLTNHQYNSISMLKEYNKSVTFFVDFKNNINLDY